MRGMSEGSWRVPEDGGGQGWEGVMWEPCISFSVFSKSGAVKVSTPAGDREEKEGCVTSMRKHENRGGGPWREDQGKRHGHTCKRGYIEAARKSTHAELPSSIPQLPYHPTRNLREA
jgi:hypothetical protein